MATSHFGNDTIAAIATPPGRGGIAIIRISGPSVQQLMFALLGKELTPRVATLQIFYDANQEQLDEGIAIFFPGPHSFTGEDILELQGHGGPIIADLLLQRVLQLGARLAAPGEFSLRAFLNDKIDLTQAEAIADLIDASSAQAARLAMRSLQGEFSRAVHAINERIIHLRMYIEAAIDFSDEDINFLVDEKKIAEFSQLLHALQQLQQEAKQGSLLREGISAVIAGVPNVGKSSLLNCLSGKEVAIVTDIPGTTRDVMRDYILLDNVPMHIIDTAGLRNSNDVVEQEGIRRAYREIEQADILLYVQDEDVLDLAAIDTLPFTKKNNIIFIRNKIDLSKTTPSITKESGYTVIHLSAKTGEGIDLLRQHILTLIGFAEQCEGIYLARRRHLDALESAERHLLNGQQQLHYHQAPELAAEDLRQAHLALAEITGEFSADDLLGRIFANFCIGK